MAEGVLGFMKRTRLGVRLIAARLLQPPNCALR
jgi:hypothetical protein